MPKFETLIRQYAAWMIAILLFLGFHTFCYAQAGSATLSVSVTDPSGAVIPDASVVVRNVETNQEQHQTSRKSGAATFNFLKPGRYTLGVSKNNFADILVDNITLSVGDERHLQLALTVGSTSQIVNVDGSGLTLNTIDGSVSTVVDRKFVENMPLNGRSFQDLISMTPGVVTQSPQTSQQAAGYNGDFSVNGQRTESNYYTVDGVSANANAGTGSGAPQAAVGGAVSSSTALGTTQSLISVDALQEFRVESSSYSAEYGRNPGAQFVLATRSGTSNLHGTVFDYLRNDIFDANNWFNDHYGDPKSALRQNDFGGTIGGPILIPRLYDGRNRTFFFSSYEGLRLTQPQAATIQYVPDSSLRQQAPAVLQPFLNAFPVQNGLDYGNAANPSIAEFIKAYSLPSQIDSTSIRIDHKISPQLALFFRFGYTPSYSSSRTLSSVTKNNNSTQTYTLGLDSAISASFSNTFRLGYTGSRAGSAVTLDSFGGANPINLAQAMGVGGYSNSQPYFDLYFAAIGNTGLYTQNPLNKGRQWNITDTFRWHVKDHLLSFGMDYRRLLSPLAPSSPAVYTEFDSPSSILTNAADYSEVTNTVGATPIFNQTSLFLQDEWQVSKHLSLSLGLRWEINPPLGAENGNVPYTLSGNIDDPSTLTLAPHGTPLWKTTWYDFAPRLGIAWTAYAEPGWETVLRGGGGVFFDNANALASEGYDAVGFSAFQEYFGSPLPFTHTQVDFPATVISPSGNEVFAFPAHLQLPYTLQWNTSIEQGLSKDQSLTISYVGANGRRLLQQQELDIAPLNSNFGTLFYTPGGVTSNYQALQTKFQRAVTKGLQGFVSYTWSHSLDFGSTSTARPLTRGNSDFDVRNNFQGGLSWELPGSRRRLVGLFTDHWGLDGRLIARSAFPITLEGNQLTDPATGSKYFNNVNLVPDQPIYLYGSQYPGRRALNPKAFTTPNGTEPGNAPRNFVRGFGATQLNLAIRRNFPLADKVALQFRAESFDLLNHPNFGYVDPYFTDATFGQATKTLDQSLATVASQYQQGGARSFQFALKIIY